jgi:hypothetical protein
MAIRQEVEKMSEGRKDDEGKLRFDLIPPRALMLLAKVYTTGAKKYDDRNWEKGMSWSRIYGAIQRHLWKFWNGEEMDAETGVPHLINAAWGCFTLTEYMFTHTELDDRQKLRQTWEEYKERIDKFMSSNGRLSCKKKERVEIYCNDGQWADAGINRIGMIAVCSSDVNGEYEYFFDDRNIAIYRIKIEV